MPKVIKIPLIAITILVGMALICLALVQTSWFKNKATDWATSYLSKELATEVHIGEVQLDYFDALTATDVYIADRSGDTLFFIQNLTADYDLFSFTQDEVRLNHVKIDHGVVKIGNRTDEKGLNLQFLINYFTPPPSGEPKPAPRLVFDKVELIETSFHYFNENSTPPTSRAFDENDMRFTQITGHLHNFEIINDSLTFVIDDLSGKEKSGLDIKNLSASTIISRSTMEFEELQLTTPKSDISDYLRFDYDGYGEFSDFIKKVEIEAKLDGSKIHTDDLALFHYSLQNYQELIQASGSITGPIAYLKSNDLQLAVGNHTRFNGRAKLKGLPDIYTTHFDVMANSLRTNTTDLARLIELDPAPQEFLQLGKLHYVGSFVGYLSDFTTASTIQTDAGTVQSNVHIQQGDATGFTYKGTVSSTSFNLGSVLSNPLFTTASFDLELDGSGLESSTATSMVSGAIHHFGFDNYDYQNIQIKGNLNENLFKGHFDINDPNFGFNFDGTLDATQANNQFAITTNVKRINLKTLGLDSLNTFVRFDGNIQLQGSTIDEITGRAVFDSFGITRDGRNYLLRNVQLDAAEKDSTRSYSLHSNLANIEARGQFIPSELNLLLGYMQHAIYPREFAAPETEIKSKDIHLNIAIDKYTPLYKEIFGQMQFDSIQAALDYNHATGKLSGDAYLNQFVYDVVTTPYIHFTFKNGGIQTPVNFAVNTEGFYQNDSVLFNVLNANGYVTPEAIIFETTAQRGTVLDLALAGRLIYQNDSAQVYVDDSRVNIYNEKWILRESRTPNLIYHDGITELRSLDFRNGEQILYVDASIGNQADKMNIFLEKFQLDNLNPFLTGFDLSFQGLMTEGYIDVSDREGYPIIETNINIEDLQMDNDTLGDLKLLSENTSGLYAVDIQGNIKNGLLNDLEILGKIDFEDKKSPLDLSLKTRKSSIKPFEKYLSGLASNISGYSYTDISISGPLTSPQLKGEIRLDSLNFMVDYLQTSYNGNATVDVDYNQFALSSATLYDRFGKKGIATGKVSHRNFHDFLFDISIFDLENFEIMNTSREDNDLFYGTAFVDGKMHVSGPLDDIYLQIDAKSRKGTEIILPLENSEASGKLNYVQFVNLKEDVNQLNNAFKATSGVRMDFNFEVTNDASIQLIFDELLGDKIEAAGHGNLRMEVNTYGDFNMYGDLTVDRGSYLFTALDLINKYFTVKPGGTLLWNGNPYNAEIDLEAIKREYAVPKPLLEGSISTADTTLAYTSIPVDCYLKLTGLLINPEVSFDIAFPNQTNISSSITSDLNALVERIRQDQEELNRQVFALLVLGTFVPPSFAQSATYNAAAGAQNTGINSLSDFASSQLNNLLSQLNTEWKFGIDYQANTLDERQSTELILSIKRKLSDRLEVSASVDAAAQGARPYDISINYDITEDGNLKVKGFQKSANDPTLGNINNVTTMGVGLNYRYQFDRFRLRRKKVKPEE